MNGHRIYYLNPPYADLSIERELLEGSRFELVPLRVQGDIIEQIADAAAIMTHQVPISESIAAQLRNCKVKLSRDPVFAEMFTRTAAKSRSILGRNRGARFLRFQRYSSCSF